VRLIGALQLQRLVIVGHSLGGEIAIRIAAARSSDVVGLAVVDFAPDPIREGSERVRSDFNESMRTWRSVEEYASWLRERRPLVDPVLIQELASSALRKAAEGGFRPKCDPAMGRGNTAQSPAEIWRLLQTILVPTLIIRGVGSAVVSNEISRQMRNTLRNGCTYVVDSAGHAVMTDNPEGFTAALSPFLMRMRMESSIEGHA
jgi:pimeloyl-ACP methyl ester carboxylesterase